MKVYVPDPAVKVPLLVIPPLIVIGEFPELLSVAPELTVNNPVNCLAPVALLIVSVDALDTVVVPVIVKANAAASSDDALVPSPTVKLPPTETAEVVVAEAVPLNTRLPLIVDKVLTIVFVPEPENVKLLTVAGNPVVLCAAPSKI